jgi:hypothetical protein
MTVYELTTLSTVIFGAGKASPGIQDYLAAPETKGTLLGAWTPDIGSLNKVVLLRGYDTDADMLAERRRARLSDNPFGCVEFLTGLEMDSYQPLDFMPPIEPGAHGPVYELRIYKPKLGRLAETIEKWRAAVPARSAASPVTTVMYSLDGPTRYTQFWPYKSLEERSRIRAETVANGVWPPKGGPDALTDDMTSMVLLPLPFSPLK